MRITIAASVLAALLVVSTIGGGDAAKRPSRSSGGGGAARRPGGGRSRGGSGSGSGVGGGGGRPRGPPPHSKPRRKTAAYDDDDDSDESEDDGDDDIPFGLPNDDDDDAYDDDEFDSDAAYEEEYDERPMPSARRPSGKRGPPMVGVASRKGRGGRGGPPTPPTRARGPPSKGGRSRYDDFEEDEYDAFEDSYRPTARGASKVRGGPPPRSRGSRGGRPGGSASGGGGGRGGRRGGSVVPYSRQQPASAFSRGLSAIRDRVPDVATVRDAAVSSVTAAKETTTKLSSNIYREVKGLTSSELEQVMLKATRPDDAPVKGKHVERLVGVTYQISGRYDIYDAVLRKLWSKMTEKDWRTSLKALYILHRFSADGAPDHQSALKARLRELRRTRDPKRKGGKYFNSKTFLSGDEPPEAKPYVQFMSRYAHYVLLRAQCFGGMFNEISQESSAPPSSRSSKSKAAAATKPITATALRTENLEGAKMILKAGCSCALKEDEVCESTAMCVERVVSDLIGLTTATAIALNRALKGGRDSKGADPAIVKKWCQFYSDELLPQTKGLMKRTTPELDAYGMFLPSRMGASVSGELLRKGLQGGDDEGKEAAAGETNTDVKEKKETEIKASEEPAEASKEEDKAAEAELEEVDDEDLYDEYSYDEYYDDEEA